MPPRMLHGRLHVMGSLKAVAMTALIALLALGVSGGCRLQAAGRPLCSQLQVMTELRGAGYDHADCSSRSGHLGCKLSADLATLPATPPQAQMQSNGQYLMLCMLGKGHCLCMVGKSSISHLFCACQI